MNNSLLCPSRTSLGWYHRFTDPGGMEGFRGQDAIEEPPLALPPAVVLAYSTEMLTLKSVKKLLLMNLHSIPYPILAFQIELALDSISE